MVGPGRTDEQLLSSYAAGGAVADEAFAELVRRHGGLVYQTCLRVVGRWVTAQDAAQATFIVLARRPTAVRSNVVGFLHAVAVKVARRADRADRIRHARDREAAEARSQFRRTEAASATQEWVEQIAPHLDAAIRRLPQMQRTAVLLRYAENRSQADIAAELGVARGTVETHLRRAVEALRRRLARHARGLTTSALATALLAGVAEASCPPFLSAGITARAAASVGTSFAATAAPHLVAMAQGAIRMMWWAKAAAAAMVIGSLALAGAGGLFAVREAWSHGLGADTYHPDRPTAQRAAVGPGPTIPPAVDPALGIISPTTRPTDAGVPSTSRPDSTFGSISGRVSTKAHVIVYAVLAGQQLDPADRTHATELPQGGPFRIANLPAASYHLHIIAQGDDAARFSDLTLAWSDIAVRAGADSGSHSIRLTPADAEAFVDEVLVTFKPDVPVQRAEAVIRSLGCQIKGGYPTPAMAAPGERPYSAFYLLDIPDSKTVQQMVAAFTAIDDVQSVQANDLTTRMNSGNSARQTQGAVQ